MTPAASLARPANVITPLTVREILEEAIALKLV
jgi:hypothetical protein